MELCVVPMEQHVKHGLARDKRESELVGTESERSPKHLLRICGSGDDIVRVCKQRSTNSLGTGPYISCTIVGIDRVPASQIGGCCSRDMQIDAGGHHLWSRLLLRGRLSSPPPFFQALVKNFVVEPVVNEDERDAERRHF